MNIYQEKTRQSLISRNVHLNDDIENFTIGQANANYDIEEHEQYV